METLEGNPVEDLILLLAWVIFILAALLVSRMLYDIGRAIKRRIHAIRHDRRRHPRNIWDDFDGKL